MKTKPFAMNRNLTLLLSGRVVSDIGSSIQMMIMPLFIIDRGGDAAMVGLFSFLSLVPILLMYPFGGVFGDRLNRKWIMVTADLFSGTMLLILAVFSMLNRISWVSLFAVQILVSLAFGFFDPASKGLLPELVPKDKLAQTNSKIATLRILSGISAPLIAVSLYTTFGITLLFLINGMSFLISGVSELFIKYKPVPKVIQRGAKGVMMDLSQGMKFILNHKLIKNMSFFFLLSFALIQPVFAVILPLFFRTELAYTDSQYGMIQVALFIGALLGSILVGFASKNGRLKGPFEMGITAVFIFMFGFALVIHPRIVSGLGNSSVGYLVLFTAVIFLLYTAIMFFVVPIQTIIQKSTDEEYMSRVFSIVGMISKGGMPLGALIYGVVLNRFPVHGVVTISAVFLAALSVLFLTSKTIQGIREVEEIKTKSNGG